MYRTVLKRDDDVFQKPFPSSDKRPQLCKLIESIDKQMPSSGLSDLKKIEISPQSDNTE